MQITIEIENEQELLSLWHRLNINDNKLASLVHEDGYKWKGVSPSEANGPYSWWKIVNKLVKKLGLQDQL